MPEQGSEMAVDETKQVQEQLVLGSQLAEMARLPDWVQSLAATYGIAPKVKFAIDLCLEEVVSNVIRHGYADSEGRFVTVHFSAPQPGHFVFAVEDDAAPFNPLEQEELPKIGDQDEFQIGGQGIRLLRGFASSVEYEPRANGNRLVIGFVNPPPAA